MAPTSSNQDMKYINPDTTKVGLTFGNFLTLVAVVAAGVIAWQKIPSETDVERITQSSVRTVRLETKADQTLVNARLASLEENAGRTTNELVQMNKRLNTLLIVVASNTSSGKDPQVIASKIRRNIEEGVDPLQGLPFGG